MDVTSEARRFMRNVGDELLRCPSKGSSGSGGMEVGNSGKRADGRSDKMNNRLQATVAGLQELEILRRRQQQMVEDVRKMLQASTRVGGRGDHSKTGRNIADEAETDPSSVPHSCPECDLLKVRQSLGAGRDLHAASPSTTSPFRPIGGSRRSPEPCGILVPQRHRRLQQQRATRKLFSQPREFSGTTYNFPSPMHAVLLQYHWTAADGHSRGDDQPAAETDGGGGGHQGLASPNATSPAPEVSWPSLRRRSTRYDWSSEIDSASEPTKMLGLPFMFLREQIKPENNSLEIMHRSAEAPSAELTTEEAEKEDTLSSVSSLSSKSTASISSFSSLKLRRFSLSSFLEEGYFSRPETPSSAGSVRRRLSRASTNSQSESSSVTPSGSDDSTVTETDLPESFRLLEDGLKPTRLTGLDDSWTAELERLPQLRDSVL